MASCKSNFIENKTKWNNDTVYAFGMQKTIITFLGYWPEYFDDKLSKIRVNFFSAIQIVIVIIFIKKFIFYGNCGTNEELIDALTLITLSLLSVIKIILPWYQKKLYNNILNSLMNDWYCVDVDDDDKSRKIMLKYAKIGRIVLIIQFIGTYGSLIPMILRYPSVIEEANGYNNDTILLRSIPLGPRCWIPMTLSWYLYVGYYFLLCIDLLILSTAFVGSDIFVFTIAMHICGQFKILYNSIENINYHKNRKQQCLIIKNFVIRHNELIEILEQFEEACNVIIFFEVFANIFVICITGSLMLRSLQISDQIMALKMMIRMFVLFVQLFLYSYIGEWSSYWSSNLQLAIWNCNWYDLSPSLVKDLSFIILRTQYEFHLTAGKIQNMNMSSFKDIMKSIFSLLSILRLMFDN